MDKMIECWGFCPYSGKAGGETMMEEEEEEKERDCRERPDMITKRIKRQRRRTLDSKDAAM